MNEIQFEEVLGAVLQEGLDDWISLAQIIAVASFYDVQMVPSPREGEDMVPVSEVERIVRYLVSRGLARIGDVYSRGHFVPFDGDDESAIEWMVEVYRTYGPAWPFEAWLDLTEKGEELARSLPRARYLDG